MTCEHCKREGCRPVVFTICGECEGAGCGICKDSLVPGVLPAAERSPEGGNITVCSEWADPEVDAALDYQRASLISAVAAARDAVIRDREE
jgi:hypothetical protein